MYSIFSMMENENLTTIKIRYDYRTEIFRYYGAREWEDDFDFSKYNKDFIIEDILTDKSVFFNTEEMEKLFLSNDIEPYMSRIANVTGKAFWYRFLLL